MDTAPLLLGRGFEWCQRRGWASLFGWWGVIRFMVGQELVYRVSHSVDNAPSGSFLQGGGRARWQDFIKGGRTVGFGLSRCASLKSLGCRPETLQGGLGAGCSHKRLGVTVQGSGVAKMVAGGRCGQRKHLV